MAVSWAGRVGLDLGPVVVHMKKQVPCRNWTLRYFKVVNIKGKNNIH
jgi:hypothetical protein